MCLSDANNKALNFIVSDTKKEKGLYNIDKRNYQHL